MPNFIRAKAEMSPSFRSLGNRHRTRLHGCECLVGCYPGYLPTMNRPAEAAATLGPTIIKCGSGEPRPSLSDHAGWVGQRSRPRGNTELKMIQRQTRSPAADA